MVSYNIHGWTTTGGDDNVDAVGDVLEQLDADIIALNEVFAPGRRGGTPLDDLARRLGYSTAFGACLVLDARGGARVAYGNALLSRLPLSSVRSGLLQTDRRREQRGFVVASVTTPTGDLTVAVTHLDHADEAVRVAQWTDLVRQLEPGGLPQIIAGDFNAVRRDSLHPADFELLRSKPGVAHLLHDPVGPVCCSLVEAAGYADALVLAGADDIGSFIPSFPPLRFDYVWVDSSLHDAVTGAGIWPEPAGDEASDHRPVFADLELRSNAVVRTEVDAGVAVGAEALHGLDLSKPQ